MCPLSPAALTQVEIIRSFTAKQPDELSLQVADVVLIYQRVSDGEWGFLGARPMQLSGCHRMEESHFVFNAHVPYPFGFLICTCLSSINTIAFNVFD